jgi:hypothetical protein
MELLMSGMEGTHRIKTEIAIPKDPIEDRPVNGSEIRNRIRENPSG